ncbi:hypothetical protein D9M70_531230 [compost metagenome]
MVLHPQPVGEHAEERLAEHEAHQCGSHDEAHRLGRQPDRDHQKLLHVGGEGIEVQRTTDGEGDHQGNGALVLEQPLERAGLLLVHVLPGGAFMHRTAQVDHHYSAQGTDEERDAPAPFDQFFLAQGLLQGHHRQ